MAAQIDVNFINPFVLSTIDVLLITTQLRPERTGLGIKQKDECCFGDISGIIGFAGDITGSLAISFPGQVAMKIIECMIGEKPESLNDQMVRDGVGEICNMIVGHAKGSITNSLGLHYSLSLPSVICGENHHVSHSSKMFIIVIKFMIPDLGPFTVEVCFKQSNEPLKQ
ncbi:MAG: chemotaxis protein CheX [Candidatus Aureabacteria bacterium]|nr:chemotaxis protein CheX [Candidatus Auribacterota bacterium]